MAGLLIGLQTGLEVALLSGLGYSIHSAGSSGPNLLADFDFSTPANSYDFSSTFATDEWLLQESSGSYANSGSGSETLSNTGGLMGQEAVGLFDGTDYVSRNAFEATDGSSKAVASGNTAGDAGTSDFAFRVIFRTPSAWAANDYLISKTDGSVGWWVYFVSNQLNFGVRDGTTLNFAAKTSFDTSGYDDGAWHYAAGWYDASTGETFLKSDLFTEVIDPTPTALSTLAVAAPLRVNGYSSSTRGTQKSQYASASVCVGANAQAMYDEAITLPGTDPSALLTTQTRASLISVPVSPTHVAHFPDDALPIGYHAALAAGAGGYGAYCNSAVTNLIDYSEDFTASGWNNTGANETAAQGSAPDGFYSATDLTAASNNGYIWREMAVASSSEYTQSIWVKRNQGTDVSGKLSLYDNASATATDQAFTATDTWQVIQVTHTSDGSATNMRHRTYIDTSGESILIWGAQLNLGNGRGAYIRTNGSSAVLAIPNYAAAASAGVLMSAAAGEIEAVYVAALPTSYGASPYVFDAGEASGNVNRRFLWLASNGTTPGAYGYSSAGSGVWALSSGAKDTDGQENTSLIRWDGSGGLAVGGGADAELLYNAAGSTTDVGTFSSSESITTVQLAKKRGGSGELDCYISRIRIWDGER